MFRLVALLVGLLALTTTRVEACSTQACVDNGEEFRSDFTVHVTHEDKPLQGVSVQITSAASDSGQEATTIKTDVRGNARISGLPTGNYWIRVDYLGIGAGSQCFHVSTNPSRKAKKKLKYDWGDMAPSTQSVSGRAIDIQTNRSGTVIDRLRNQRRVPIVGATITVHGAVNGVIQKTETNLDGEFQFADMPEGIYVLHIEGGRAGERDYDSADLLLQYSPRGRYRSLLIARRETGAGSCGGTSMQMSEDTPPQ